MQTRSFTRFLRKLEQVTLHERDLRKPPPPQPTARVDETWSRVRSEILDPNTGQTTFRKWWVSPSQAARIYAVSTEAFYGWMKRGNVSWVFLPNGRKVIPVEWIIANLVSPDRRGFRKVIEQRRFQNRRQAIKHIKARIEIVVPKPEPLLA